MLMVVCIWLNFCKIIAKMIKNNIIDSIKGFNFSKQK